MAAALLSEFTARLSKLHPPMKTKRCGWTTGIAFRSLSIFRDVYESFYFDKTLAWEPTAIFNYILICHQVPEFCVFFDINRDIPTINWCRKGTTWCIKRINSQQFLGEDLRLKQNWCLCMHFYNGIVSGFLLSPPVPMTDVFIKSHCVFWIQINSLLKYENNDQSCADESSDYKVNIDEGGDEYIFLSCLGTGKRQFSNCKIK